MPGMTTTKLPYIDYYMTIRRARDSEWQREWKTALVSYTILDHASKNGKVHTNRDI